MNARQQASEIVVGKKFLQRMIHDLRSPVHAVTCFLGLLKAELPTERITPDAREYLDVLTASAEETRLQVRALAEFVHAFEEREIGAVDVRAVVERALDAVREQTGYETLQWHNAVGCLVVKADELALQKCFEAILTNSVVFRKPEQLLSIAVTQVNLGDDEAIRIEDNGIGIARHHLARCLEPFERLQARSRHVGIGLGLPTAIALLEHLGAELSVTSDGQQGTTVEIRFRRSSLVVT